MTELALDALVEKLLLDRALLMRSAPVALPVKVEEDPDPTPPSDGRYLEARNLRNKAAWSGLSNGNIPQGILSITLHWGRAAGTVEPMNKAGAVAAHFPAGMKLYYGGVKVEFYQRPDITPLIPDTRDCQLVISIPYRVYSTQAG